MQTTARAEVITAPAEEPLTLAEVRDHVELASGDTSHDTELTRAVEDARQQWEQDTSEYFVARTMRLTMDRLCEM